MRGINARQSQNGEKQQLNYQTRLRAGGSRFSVQSIEDGCESKEERNSEKSVGYFSCKVVPLPPVHCSYSLHCTQTGCHQPSDADTKGCRRYTYLFRKKKQTTVCRRHPFPVTHRKFTRYVQRTFGTIKIRPKRKYLSKGTAASDGITLSCHKPFRRTYLFIECTWLVSPLQPSDQTHQTPTGPTIPKKTSPNTSHQNGEKRS